MSLLLFRHFPGAAQTSVASAAAVVWTVPAAAASVGAVTVSATPASSSWSVPGAVAVAGGVTVPASAASALWTVPAATAAAGGVTVPASAAQALWTVPAAAATTGIVSAATAASASWTVPPATASVGAISTPAAAARATWGVPHAAAVVVGGIVPVVPAAGGGAWRYGGVRPPWPWVQPISIAAIVEIEGVEAHGQIGDVVVVVESPIATRARQRLGDLARGVQAAAAARILAAEHPLTREARAGLRLLAFEAKARRAWAA